MDSINKVKERLRVEACCAGREDMLLLLSSHNAQAEEIKRLREFKNRVMAWAHKNLANRCKTCGTRCATACYHCGERGAWKGWTPAWEVQP